MKRLARFLKKYAEVEDGLLTAACDGGEWVLGCSVLEIM